MQLPRHEGVMAWPLERSVESESATVQPDVRGAVRVQSTADGVQLANGPLTVEPRATLPYSRGLEEERLVGAEDEGEVPLCLSPPAEPP